MSSYLHIKRFLGQEKTIELLGGWSTLSCKDKVKKMKNWLKNQSLLSLDQKKELEMTSALEEGPVAFTSSRNIQREAQRTSEEEERSQEPSGKGQRQIKLAQTLPTRVQDPRIGAFSCGQCLQYGQDSYGIHIPRAGKDEQDLSTQIRQEIEFVKSSIDVELGKFEAKLNKITSDISELKINDKNYTEWYKLTNVKFDSITNTCDRIESKCQAQNDEREDLAILNINDQLRILKDHVLEIINNNNQLATHLARSDSERQKLKNQIISHVEKIYKNYEPHMPRHSTPLTEEKLSVKRSLTPFLGEDPICAKYIPKLEEFPTFSGEGEYNHIELIRTIDMLQEYFHIPDESMVGKLHSLFITTEKKWYYKMRLDHGKHDWNWWKSEISTKWASNSWRSKMENSFESAVFNSEKDKTLTWFLKQKDKLSALYPDMSYSMINTKILRKCGGELEHSIKCRFLDPCSTQYYINAMEYIITRTRIGKAWIRVPMESKMVSKTCREDRNPERPFFKCHKCGRTSHVANTCTKKKSIDEAQVIEEVKCSEEKEESDLDSAVLEVTTAEDYPIKNITDLFEVTEVHTHLPQYSGDFHNLINIHDARMCKTKPTRGKRYTSGASCITSSLINDIEARVNWDKGAFCTCEVKDYLQSILPGWKNHLLPIEGVQFSSDSNNMYPLGILDTNLVFPHPAGSVRMKTEIVVMENCTS
ncbi:hypothetical protein O181_101024 [Austropuccinia psidii MF-1]|uniref:CCHC-type domain-containing protein n=1 Tax=Austropuccinia psidii MF-1 TaxID=1389203 RepID=A0A9Q3JGD2_9BASI|nr:hypothetical protein [Austropuccinia psidii MF-1]